MDFIEYQKKTDKTAIYPREYGLMYTLLGLTNEAGEVAGKAKKWLRGDISFEKLREILRGEIGDVQWYIAQLCTELNFSLEDIAKENIEKLEDRQMRNVLQGEGDDR